MEGHGGSGGSGGGGSGGGRGGGRGGGSSGGETGVGSGGGSSSNDGSGRAYPEKKITEENGRSFDPSAPAPSGLTAAACEGPG